MRRFKSYVGLSTAFSKFQKYLNDLTETFKIITLYKKNLIFCTFAKHEY